jgi:hypothetical protein
MAGVVVVVVVVWIARDKRGPGGGQGKRALGGILHIYACVLLPYACVYVPQVQVMDDA